MRRTLWSVIVAIVAASMVPGVAAATDPLPWGACPADVTGPGLQCTTLDVPLDYRNPDGPQIQIAVSRLKSSAPAQRRGILLTNTGGPGGAGLNFPADLARLGLPPNVLDSYDVIGFDPRGVGHSSPVTCALTPAQQTSNIPPYARDPIDVAQHSAAVKNIAHQCGTSATGSMLPFINTANTARDVDRIRAALGEEKLSYHGISYGTYLGAVYASLFPDRTDRVVLDSAAGPGGFDSTHSRRLAEGFQERFPDFAAFLAAHPEYGLGGTLEQVTAKYYELAAELDAIPNPAGGGYGALFRQANFGMLYFDQTLPTLAEVWRAADTGQAGDTPPAPPDQDNYLSSQLYVVCNDSAWPKSELTYQGNVAVDRVRYPMFGAAAANIWPCADWPDPVEPSVQINDRGPSNILIVQNLRDPATPLSGARELQRALGDRARMVTADQGGHLAYLFKDNTCLNDSVTTFLATGQRPQQDVACAAEPAPAGG